MEVLDPESDTSSESEVEPAASSLNVGGTPWARRVRMRRESDKAQEPEKQSWPNRVELLPGPRATKAVVPRRLIHGWEVAEGVPRSILRALPHKLWFEWEAGPKGDTELAHLARSRDVQPNTTVKV